MPRDTEERLSRVPWYSVSFLESRNFIVGVTIIGLLIRIALIYYTSAHSNPIFPDEKDYQNIGTSLSQGGPYSIDGVHLSAFRPPAQAWMIALIFRFFGPHVVYVKLLEALLLSVLPFVCSLMGRSLGLSVAAANVGAALAGLHPALAYASTTLYPTVLTTVALTIGILLSVLVIRGKGNASAIGAGLALGLAASATTTFSPVAALATLIISFRRRYSAALIVAVLGTLPVLVWMGRNEAALGRFTVATNGGYNLFMGANDFATPTSGNNLPTSIISHIPIYEEVDLNTLYEAEGVTWIKSHPLRWGKLAVLRALLVFDSVGSPKTHGLHSSVGAHVVGWVMLLPVLLSVAGLYFSYRLPLASLTIAALLLVVLTSAFTISKPRFRFPCDPELCLFSVVGFTILKRRLSGRSPQTGAS